MMELDKHQAALIAEITELINLTDETLEIKDKLYIDPGYLITYLDELQREYYRLKENYETLENMMNEDHYDRFYERGGFPL